MLANTNILCYSGAFVSCISDGVGVCVVQREVLFVGVGHYNTIGILNG